MFVAFDIYIHIYIYWISSNNGMVLYVCMYILYHLFLSFRFVLFCFVEVLCLALADADEVVLSCAWNQLLLLFPFFVSIRFLIKKDTN